jgi:hypothetical protein
VSVPNPGQEPTPTPTPGAPATPVVTQTTPEASTAPTTPNTQPTLPDRMPDVDNDAAWKGLPAWVRNDIKALRTEAAGYRVKHNEAQAKLDEIERASLSEQDRLKADVEKFQTQVIPEKDQKIRELRQAQRQLPQPHQQVHQPTLEIRTRPYRRSRNHKLRV